MEDHPATRRFRVDVFRHRTEPDLPLLESGDNLDEVADRAPKTIQPPDHQHISLAQRFQDARKAAPLALASGNAMILEYPSATRRLERVPLQTEMLIGR